MDFIENLNFIDMNMRQKKAYHTQINEDTLKFPRYAVGINKYWLLAVISNEC